MFLGRRPGSLQGIFVVYQQLIDPTSGPKMVDACQFLGGSRECVALAGSDWSNERVLASATHSVLTKKLTCPPKWCC